MNAPRLATLDAIEAAVWRELEACASDRAHPWRTSVLATSTPEGAPDARLVVLREAAPRERLLRFFTDARSPKRAQIEARPQGVMVLWSDPLGWQLRLAVSLEVHVAGLAVSSRWTRMKLSPSAHDYLAPVPPGTPLDAPPAGRATHALAEREHRGHFALVEARVQSIDWLELHTDGHRRARFDAAGARWIQP